MELPINIDYIDNKTNIKRNSDKDGNYYISFVDFFFPYFFFLFFLLLLLLFCIALFSAIIIIIIHITIIFIENNKRPWSLGICLI